MSGIDRSYFIDDLGDLNGLRFVSSAREATGLKLGEPRFGCCATLSDDPHTDSSKAAAQCISELISGAVEPSNLWCIVKHYVSGPVSQIRSRLYESGPRKEHETKTYRFDRDQR
jgi:hypothetical protein